VRAPALLALPLLAAVLAGCASTGGPLAPTGVFRPEPVPVAVQVDARVPMNWGTECVPASAACFGTTDAHDMPRVHLGRDEALASFAVVLEELDALPPGAEVLFSAECAAEVGPACPVLGEARGALPLRLEGTFTGMPQGAAVRFSAYLAGGTAHVPVVSGAAQAGDKVVTGDAPSARLTGEVVALRGPAPAPPLVPHVEVREIEGDLLCDPSDLDASYKVCPLWLRSWYNVEDLGWPVASLRIGLEWTAARETTRELVLRVECRQGYFNSDQRCEGLPAAEARGTSPLSLETAGWAPADASLKIDVYAPYTVDTPWGPIGEHLPQPYRLRVEAVVLQDPALMQ
jgi:hypothetical protein